MTKTFSDQAQTYFELYRKIHQELKEVDASITQLQRKHQDLLVQRNHMSRIIVSHIDSGEDIMMCAMHAEKPGARGEDDYSPASVSLRINGGSSANYPPAGVFNNMNTAYAATCISPSSDLSSLSSMLGHSGRWTTADIGMGSVDIYAHGSNDHKNP